MIWLTWRQFRIQAASICAGLVALAAVLAITGPRLIHLRDLAGDAFVRQLTHTDGLLYYGSLVVVYVAPAIIGTFWGAPMVTRELDAGTHRLVWNQSVTRTRWLATKLAVTGISALTAAGLLSLAVSWWASPIDSAAGSIANAQFPARISPEIFGVRGIAPIGYAAFAFILGVAAGILIRRTVPAMAVTLALFTLIQIAMPLWVRPHLSTPDQQTVTISATTIQEFQFAAPGTPVRVTVETNRPDSWILSNQTVDAGGHVVSGLPTSASDCLPHPPGVSGARITRPDTGACFAEFADLGYRQRVTYLPASRFWALQWSETAIFLGASLLLAWFCFWRARRLS